jgi:hypothetical protein
MDPPKAGISDLGISSVIKQPPLRVYLTRVPFDDFFQLRYFKDGRETSEELEADDTRKWFKEHGITDDEGLERALDECWNFGQTVINIPADVYKEPMRKFPQFQPQV